MHVKVTSIVPGFGVGSWYHLVPFPGKKKKRRNLKLDLLGMWDCYTPCFSIWFRGNWPSAICSALLELDRRDVAFPAEEGPSEWGPQETLPFLWPLCWRVTSFYLTGPSSLLSSSECWNFHCGSMFQPVNTHIFHPSWGSSFGRAFLWRSLELIILYFILLYKQHSLAKEHNHKKKPLLGGLKTKRNSFLFRVM